MTVKMIEMQNKKEHKSAKDEPEQSPKLEKANTGDPLCGDKMILGLKQLIFDGDEIIKIEIFCLDFLILSGRQMRIVQ